MGYLVDSNVYRIPKVLKCLALLLFISICLKTHAQSATDTTHKNLSTDTTKISGGKLPGFFTPNKGAKPGKDASDFYMRCGPYKPGKSQQPLILVDGKKMNYKKLQKINVNKILTITILKDSASTAKYNRRGRRNGVLLITTRKSLLSTDTAVRNRIGRDTPVIRKLRERMQPVNPANSQNEINKTPASYFIK